jgi:hypothetical protein
LAGKRIECPACGAVYQLPANLASDEVKCSKCRFRFHIPSRVLFDRIDYHPPEARLPGPGYAQPAPASVGSSGGGAGGGGAAPEKVKEASRGLKIWGVEFPGWVVMFVLLVLTGLLLAAIISERARMGIRETWQMAQATFASPDGDVMRFSRTFIFWVPRDKSDGTAYPQSAHTSFQTWVTGTFGGWTRWQVEGSGGPDPGAAINSGWFYQCSLPQDKDETVSAELIRARLTDLFPGATPYVVEQPHYAAKGGK